MRHALCDFVVYLPDRPASIDIDDLAGNEVRGWSSEENDSALQFGEITPAPHGRALINKIESFGVIANLFYHIGFEISRADGIDTNTLWAALIKRPFSSYPRPV